VIVVDNGSKEENREELQLLSKELQFSYCYHPSEFEYSTLCNFGAAKATGDILLFMNDDIEVTESNHFMQKMMHYAKKTHVGAVGIKLLYPETKLIQHVGITDLDVGPSHKLATFPDDKVYEQGRNRLNYNVLAVTGACLMIEKGKFEEVGGFDERIKVSYTDVDLCVDLYEKGYFNIVVNECFLLHYESVSRGNDIQNAKKRERLLSEKKFFYQKHPFLKQKGDPFYHKYFSRNSLAYGIDYPMEWEKKDHFTAITPVNEKRLVLWKSDSFHYNIDRIDLKMPEEENEFPVYEIEGWCFFSRKNNLRFQKELILVSENDQMQCSVISKYRKDLEDVFPGERYIMMSGFVCKIPVSKLSEDVSYDVKVAMTSEWTGKCYVKETKWQIKNKKV
jgi:GT2 family glycosyltransferase